ncbi:porin, partial [Delftia tsuruhatensis]
FASDTGMGSSSTGALTFGRQSEVNLSGNFGMLRLGNFFPGSYFATADYVSMHNHDTGSSSDALYFDPVWFASGLGTANKISYTTPNFGGLTVEGSVSMHEKATALAKKKNGYDLAANYNVGPLALGAGYSQFDEDKQLAFRAAYTLGQFVLGGYYQRNDEEIRGTRNNFRLSGMYTLGASEFHVNLGHANKWSNIADSGANQWTLGYNYNLSKRTKVYGYYTKVDNKAGANYMTGVKGADFSSFAVGVRHAF